MKNPSFSWARRDFLKSVGAAAAAAAMSRALFAGGVPVDSPVLRRKLGRTGEMLSIIGLGGHTLALAASEKESVRIVHEAVDAGINLMDNAWEYHEGRAESLMGKALEGLRDRVFLMTKVCTHGKGADAAMKMLEESLQRLRTDRLDLWMIHAIENESEVEAAFAPGGVVEALELAKKQGKVRFTGFTGHRDPPLHLAMLRHDYPFDAVLLPVNCFEPERTGFRADVVPELNRRGIGILGMKSLGGTPARAVTEGKVTAGEAIRFSLSQPITSQVLGMSSLQNLRDNIDIARHFSPMPQVEMDRLTARLAGAEARFTQYTHPDYRDGHGLARPA